MLVVRARVEVSRGENRFRLRNGWCLKHAALNQPTPELRCLPIGTPGFISVLLADAIPQFSRFMGKAHDMIL